MENKLLISRSKRTIKGLKQRHPHCFSENLFGGALKNWGNNKTLSLSNIGKYKLVGNNVMSSVSYDHQCRYMLKDRYNCARSKDDDNILGEGPTDWKLMLEPGQNGTTGETTGECNLWDFVHELGGPVGVADTLKVTKNPSSEKQKEKRPFIVLMMGNSYVRQIFEALACGWSADVSDYRANVGSKTCYSVSCIEKHGEQKFRVSQVGDLLPPIAKAGFNHSQKRRFYRPGVALPTEVFSKNVTDDLAMVEFGNSIRFYFMFRPYTHYNLNSAINQVLDLDPANIDMLLFNGNQNSYVASTQKRLKRVFKSTGAWQSRSLWPTSQFPDMQKRDIGRWFGADNPWITNVPDDHACMPGPPDDMANLVLFSIFSDASIRP